MNVLASGGICREPEHLAKMRIARGSADGQTAVHTPACHLPAIAQELPSPSTSSRKEGAGRERQGDMRGCSQGLLAPRRGPRSTHACAGSMVRSLHPLPSAMQPLGVPIAYHHRMINVLSDQHDPPPADEAAQTTGEEKAVRLTVRTVRIKRQRDEPSLPAFVLGGSAERFARRGLQVAGKRAAATQMGRPRGGA